MTPAEAHHPAISRRRLLEVGSLGLLGLSLSDVEMLRAGDIGELPEFESSLYPRAKSVIFVFLGGGLSQLDSFDMKPLAPAEVRGEFKPIATSTPGIDICEHLPQLAACSQLWSMCRSLTHKEQAHGPRDWPSIAAMTTYAVRIRPISQDRASRAWQVAPRPRPLGRRTDDSARRRRHPRRPRDRRDRQRRRRADR